MALLTVEEALGRVLEGVGALPPETVPLNQSLDRILADDIASLRTQPPWDTSAMDGYAVRSADVTTVPVRLKVIGSAPAGHSYNGCVGPGEAVRIFTGAPMPEGADAIVIQEDTERDGADVTVLETSAVGRFVRKRGLDFARGEILLNAGRRLGPRHIALAAAMNHPQLPVTRQPNVAILATGDELVAPGTDPGPDHIIASNGYGIAGLVRRAGGMPIDLGIAPDNRQALSEAIGEAVNVRADVLITLGGASVGEHDIVQDVLEAHGLALDFWKIAMRPGKPLIFGRLGDMRVLGLPGNPVSSMVCGRLFLVPLVHALLGNADVGTGESMARLGGELRENDQRQDYLRATLSHDDAGGLVATPFAKQDSSMLATLVKADAFIIRPPHAPPAKAGEACRVLVMDF